MLHIHANINTKKAIGESLKANPASDDSDSLSEVHNDNVQRTNYDGQNLFASSTCPASLSPNHSNRKKSFCDNRQNGLFDSSAQGKKLTKMMSDKNDSSSEQGSNCDENQAQCHFDACSAYFNQAEWLCDDKENADLKTKNEILKENSWANNKSGSDERTNTLSTTFCDMTKEEVCEKWSRYMCERLSLFLDDAHGKQWKTEVVHIEFVKSYAPHIYHVVFDVKCQKV